MATLKRKLYRKNSSGTYDTVYFRYFTSISWWIWFWMWIREHRIQKRLNYMILKYYPTSTIMQLWTTVNERRLIELNGFYMNHNSSWSMICSNIKLFKMNPLEYISKGFYFQVWIQHVNNRSIYYIRRKGGNDRESNQNYKAESSDHQCSEQLRSKNIWEADQWSNRRPKGVPQ